MVTLYMLIGAILMRAARLGVERFVAGSVVDVDVYKQNGPA